MATKSQNRSRPVSPPKKQPNTLKQSIQKHFLLWLLGGIILLTLLPGLLAFTVRSAREVVSAAPGILLNAGEDLLHFAIEIEVKSWEAGRESLGDLAGWAAVQLADINIKLPTGGGGSTVIAPLFTAQVAHWDDEIIDWAETYNLDPNLLATVMQIESCGHPTVNSPAGAQGLFQVMPFHFASDENMLDPDTNAMRGASVLNDCLRRAGGDPGLAMACYNGGPSVISKPMSNWLAEPQRFYYWGTGIYADAQQNEPHSGRLDEWLNAGGIHLCRRADDALGLD